jgi:hypothetical protein
MEKTFVFAINFLSKFINKKDILELPIEPETEYIAKM